MRVQNKLNWAVFILHVFGSVLFLLLFRHISMQRFLISVFRQPVVGDDATHVTVPDTVSKECHMPSPCSSSTTGCWATTCSGWCCNTCHCVRFSFQGMSLVTSLHLTHYQCCTTACSGWCCNPCHCVRFSFQGMSRVNSAKSPPVVGDAAYPVCWKWCLQTPSSPFNPTSMWTA